MVREKGKQEKAGEQETWGDHSLSVPEQPLGQRLGGHIMGDYAPPPQQ